MGKVLLDVIGFVAIGLPGGKFSCRSLFFSEFSPPGVQQKTRRMSKRHAPDVIPTAFIDADA